ncbi:bifunctional diaminohydroxyphosphoribosylaminopyrimidine deaminase/5-amino-6-(5-phosphoribosylamino)uracil reductase [Shigella sonnei]|nr:bifunctional diaminohydroxyphosphoribosylaminopyrimidine deaminase/5-amino-6-(5-phosphoribosylamino)uracil reductase [Shigella sonnei]
MQDEYYMARALKLAQRGRFTTHPNPNVGGVIVKDGEIVGEGYHQRAGEPHAEYTRCVWRVKKPKAQRRM